MENRIHTLQVMNTGTGSRNDRHCICLPATLRREKVPTILLSHDPHPRGFVRQSPRAVAYISPFPSFAIVSKAAGLIVTGETLVFECGHLYEGEPDAGRLQNSFCRVSAEYRVTSVQAVDAGFEFIGPSEDAVGIEINGKPAESKSSRLQLSRDDAARIGIHPACRHCAVPDDENSQPLFSVLFSGALIPGANVIRVTYKQPLASDEISYGYFQISLWAQGFSYELWPLREWKLDPAFKMKIEIRSARAGFFARLAGNQKEWQCRGMIFSRRPSLPLAGRKGSALDTDDLKKEVVPLVKTSQGDQLIQSGEFGAAFPDRLTCSIRAKD